MWVLGHQMLERIWVSFQFLPRSLALFHHVQDHVSSVFPSACAHFVTGRQRRQPMYYVSLQK